MEEVLRRIVRLDEYYQNTPATLGYITLLCPTLNCGNMY